MDCWCEGTGWLHTTERGCGAVPELVWSPDLVTRPRNQGV